MVADGNKGFALDGAPAPAAINPHRDPCMDPQPGDALAVLGDVRLVLDRVGDRVEYGFPRRAASRWLPLVRWQAWARNAQVL